MPVHRPLALLAGLFCASLWLADVSLARDWLSPSPLPAQPPAPSAAQDPPAWAGMVWQGPARGAPAAPAARHCRRAPAPFVIDAQPEAQAAGPRERIAPLAALFAPRGAGLTEAGDAPSPAGRAKAEASPAVRAADAADPSPAPPAPGAAGAALLPRRPAPAPQPAPIQRPADEAVTAGLVDDNADFGEYLAFRQRRTLDLGQRLPRTLAVAERVRLEVRDARGLAVPDAAVAVYAAGRAQPLWARTDAAGRAWLMPQADMAGSVFEVQVSKGGESTRVLWQRGQKDALQAQLSGAAPPPARLDVAFLIDATGSMGDEIDKLKRSMRSIADEVARLPSRPDLCWALVAYRDRGDAFLVRGTDFSHDLAAFQAELAQLQAGGGGDYPEALSEALHTAVHRLSWRGEGTARLLLLVADAPPQLQRGAPHFDDEVRAAAGRGIKLHAVGASGLDALGEYCFRLAAQFTGGRFVFLTYADAARPASGPGRETVHDVRNYSVQTLDQLVVRLVADELAAWPVLP